MHRDSYHPWVMRQAIYAEMHKTALVCSSFSTWKQSAVNRVNEIFEENGYTSDEIVRFQRRCELKLKKRNDDRSRDRFPGKPILKIPYICEKFTSDVRMVLRRSRLDVRIVHRRAGSLQKLGITKHRKHARPLV
ncbi:hypothetical protein ACOME3_008325 [Neoechinorhynchus agilis]